MRLLFKQRLFSWFDSYDVYDESGNTVFTVKGQFSWGKTLKIFDAAHNELGTVKSRLFSFMPKFDLYQGDHCFGTVSKEFTFFKPKFHIDCNGWQVEGSFWEWDYTIRASYGEVIAKISKEVFRLTDTYVIDVSDPKYALQALMLVIAIDAEKDQRD